jgi:hypothetical protein
MSNLKEALCDWMPAGYMFCGSCSQWKSRRSPLECPQSEGCPADDCAPTESACHAQLNRTAGKAKYADSVRFT